MVNRLIGRRVPLPIRVQLQHLVAHLPTHLEAPSPPLSYPNARVSRIHSYTLLVDASRATCCKFPTPAPAATTEHLYFGSGFGESARPQTDCIYRRSWQGLVCQQSDRPPSASL